MIDSIRRLFGMPDSYGLRYSTTHLLEKQQKVAFLSRPEQSKYADEVCRSTVNNPDFLRNQFTGIDINNIKVYEDFNTTSVGNLAYISLYACLPEIRRKAEQMLRNYLIWIESLGITP